MREVPAVAQAAVARRGVAALDRVKVGVMADDVLSSRHRRGQAVYRLIRLCSQLTGDDAGQRHDLPAAQLGPPGAEPGAGHGGCAHHH